VKLAVLGGSFNPIHNGHLHCADAALTACGFDRLLLIPANISPFKQAAAAAAAADRLDMILASVAGDHRLIVDDTELRRGGVSYTVDTLREIIERYRPEGKPALILGDDLAADFYKWKEPEEIIRIADIVIARRIGGGDQDGGGAAPEFAFPHRTLRNEVVDIASAVIRERISCGGAWRYLVPRGARLIIEERGMYSPARPAGKGPSPAGKRAESAGKRAEPDAAYKELIASIEDAARAVLPAGRFIHSRNTAIVARDLAALYGLDEDAAYLAGIAHDIAKNDAAKPKAKSIFHGKAAAVLLQKRFGIHNKDVLEAVEAHTTGKRYMGDVAKVVFIADKIEFSRKGEDGVRFREMIEHSKGNGKAYGLDDLFYAVLKSNVRWLKETGIETAEESLWLLKNHEGVNGE